jgi:hypothetical protein
MRIALGVVLAFAALWFVALRPKPVTDEPAPAPAPVAQDATKAPAPSEPQTAAKPAEKAAPAPTDAASPAQRKKFPKAVRNVLADLDAKKVVVLLFWEPAADDDKAVRKAVDQVDTRGGKVAVHSWNISRVGDFEPITRGVPVVLAPTVMVIDRDRKAQTIEGLTQAREIDDLVTRSMGR